MITIKSFHRKKWNSYFRVGSVCFDTSRCFEMPWCRFHFSCFFCRLCTSYTEKRLDLVVKSGRFRSSFVRFSVPAPKSTGSPVRPGAPSSCKSINTHAVMSGTSWHCQAAWELPISHAAPERKTCAARRTAI